MNSDSESSSTASDALLIVRPVSSAKPNPVRFQRCYDRKLLLALSKSDKVCSPQGLKPLSEWYGEYEPPSMHGAGGGGGHGGNANGAGGAGGRHPGGRDAAGGRRERGIAQGAERHNERDTHPRTPGTPVTGAMGDFRIPGLRSTLPNPADGGDAAFGGNRRRQNGRDGDIRDRDLSRESESKERPWSVAGAAAASGATLDRRRQIGGDFIKKDGRAAEEGGWRSSRETLPNRERLPRDRDSGRDSGRPGFGDRDRDGRDRDLRAGSDRRRQPAWMDDDEPPSRGGAGGPSATTTFQRRGLNGTAASSPSADSTPAWMMDDSPTAAGGLESSLEALEAKHSSGQTAASSGTKTEHVDSIQAWKAQMKELERKQKLQEQRELRREMGLPELSDKELDAKAADTTTKQSHASKDSSTAAPAKSVFADFLLPASSSKEKELNKAEDKPRSSRFARMFAGPDGSSQTGSQAQQAVSPQPPAAQATQGSANTNHGPPSNNLLAALLPGMPSPANDNTGALHKPASTQADSQSMARLMEMLHMSSTTPPTGASSKPSTAAPQPQGQQPQPQSQSQSQQQSQAAAFGHSQAEKGLRPSQSVHDLAYQAQNSRSHVNATAGQPRHQQQPQLQQQKDNMHEQGMHGLPMHPQIQNQNQRQPQSILSPPQSRDQMALSPNQSRLANRSSSYGNMPADLHSLTQAQDPARREASGNQHHPGAAASPNNVNLLQLLGGQISPPPGPPLPPHLHNLPQQHNASQHEQQQSGRGRPASPRHQLYPGANGQEQHQAHMQALMQAQLGQAGARGGLPQGYPGINPNQSGRPPSQGSYLPQQQQQQSQHQHQQPSHARSPSNTINPAYMMQQQQQQQAQRLPGLPPHQQAFSPPPMSHMPGLGGPGGPPFPPPPMSGPGVPPHLAQQNALAQLLASAGRPGGQQYGLSPPPGPPLGNHNETLRRGMPPPPPPTGPSIEASLGYWPGPEQGMPGPYPPGPGGRGGPPPPGVGVGVGVGAVPRQQHQQQPIPGQAQMQMQQNQIDLMALLTGGARVSGR